MVGLSGFALAPGKLPKATVSLAGRTPAKQELTIFTNCRRDHTLLNSCHYPQRCNRHRNVTRVGCTIAKRAIHKVRALPMTRRSATDAYCVTPIKYFAYHPTYRSYRSFTKLGRVIP